MSKKYDIVEKYGNKQKEGLTLSPSSIDTMEKCPKQYFLQYIAKIKVPDDQTASIFGKMFHLIIENYTGGGQEEIKALFNKFKESPLKEKYIDLLDETYKNKIVKTLRNVYFYLKNRYAKIEDFQHELQIDIHDIAKVDGKDIHIQGKLDGLYEYGDVIFITDFKSGKKRKDHSKQLGFYFYLLNKESDGKLKKVCGEIVNISLDNQKTTDDIIEYYDLEEFDIKRTENRINNAIDTLTKNGITLESEKNWEKKPQKLCDWCKYYKSGHCNAKK